MKLKSRSSNQGYESITENCKGKLKREKLFCDF